MLIGLLTSTIQAALPAGFNCSFLQMQQIPSLMENLCFERKNYFERKPKNQTEMVDTKLRTLRYAGVN